MLLQVFKNPEKTVVHTTIDTSTVGPMTYKLPDLWEPFTSPKNRTKKQPLISTNNAKSANSRSSSEHSLNGMSSLDNCILSIETDGTRPYTPFPADSSSQKEAESDDSDDEKSSKTMLSNYHSTSSPYSTEKHNTSNLPVASLFRYDKDKEASAGSPKSATSSSHSVSSSSSSSGLPLLHRLLQHPYARPFAHESHSIYSTRGSGGFSFGKAEPGPPQRDKLPELAYKRVSLGDGPNSAVILPVHPGQTAKEVAALVAQLKVREANKPMRISSSWAQTQFVAEQDPTLHLDGFTKSIISHKLSQKSLMLDNQPSIG